MNATSVNFSPIFKGLHKICSHPSVHNLVIGICSLNLNESNIFFNEIKLYVLFLIQLLEITLRGFEIAHFSGRAHPQTPLGKGY